MEIKVSVIIPVYNAEKYLPECIESLLNQTLRECEFIFVNDGSKDKSRDIINQYKAMDNRIILVNQENLGVSIARNKGLEMAQGEYIGFVDADDYVDKDMYNKLYFAAKQKDCDVVISNFQSEGTENAVNYPFPKEITLNKEYIEKSILHYLIKKENLNSVCNKLFRRKIIKIHNINFPKKVALGEDGMFNLRFFNLANNALYLDYTGYFYREVAGSATRSFLKHDYFKRALEVYSMNLPPNIKLNINNEELIKLKSEKLINSIKAFIFQVIFTNKSFLTKYKSIKRMTTNQWVREALSNYSPDPLSGRYDRAVITMMKYKFIFGLYCAASYSRLRNK